MGFGQALSGLNAASQNLDVIGNNIANSATVGFKGATATFADVFASSRGLGTQVAAVNQRFTIGTVAITGNQFDMAIDGANGLFRVLDTSGAVMYTRNGQFSANEEGYLVNAQGHRLTGFMDNPATGVRGTVPTPIQVPSGNIAPRATGTHPDATQAGVRVKFNLDQAEQMPAVAWGTNLPAPATNTPDPGSYNHVVRMTVYDSLGKDHQLTQYFRKTNTDNQWQVYYQLNNDPVAAAPSPFPISFNSDGTLTPASETTSVNFGAIAGSDPLIVPISYADSTQFAGDFGYTFKQDGYPTGAYASMAIAPDGKIIASYTNGETQEMGELVLANFANVQGLQAVGGNAWVETAQSGQPLLGTPGSNGLASIVGQAVEESNVDMSQELVNMIIAQRTYQANAQTIKTQDQLLQTLITMR
ncbi:flagellar hook protein FlgE [Parapusillimonas sp. JC17]|uniref:flagellar hook protein FlgE n=1 Tax=Parapusillimonas sp. JC17 TaxID=3445768 RepID=UPI003FA0C5E8